jgi:hypothetical protein
MLSESAMYLPLREVSPTYNTPYPVKISGNADRVNYYLTAGGTPIGPATCQTNKHDGKQTSDLTDVFPIAGTMIAGL